MRLGLLLSAGMTHRGPWSSLQPWRSVIPPPAQVSSQPLALAAARYLKGLKRPFTSRPSRRSFSVIKTWYHSETVLSQKETKRNLFKSENPKGLKLYKTVYFPGIVTHQEKNHFSCEAHWVARPLQTPPEGKILLLLAALSRWQGVQVTTAELNAASLEHL